MTEDNPVLCATLLAIDDNSDFLHLLEAYLSLDGHTLITATSGKQVLSLLAEQLRPTIDVILLDRKLGDIDGLTLIQAIKTDQHLRNIPVIMITGMTEPDDIALGIQSGAYYYMTKPISPQVLRTLVQSAMTTITEQRKLLERVVTADSFNKMIDHCEAKFKTLEDARLLACMFAQLFPDPQRVVTGISEILTNAVEHGNLGLSYEDKSRLLASGEWMTEINRRLQLPEYSDRSGCAVFNRGKKTAKLTIIDCGSGFDWVPFLEFSSDRAFDLHGRGIALSRLFSFDMIEYRGCGNEVVLTIATP